MSHSHHQDSSAINHMGQNDSGKIIRDENEKQKEALLFYHCKKLQDDLQKLSLKIIRHEYNIKLLKNQKDSLDESILEIQVGLAKYHTSRVTVTENMDPSLVQSEEETTEHIPGHENSAAGILRQLSLTTGHGAQGPYHLSLTRDVLGTVATLGQVEDDNLSRLLSEYLGKKTMLAVVCKTYGGVQALETYDKEGSIDKNSGLHALGASIARPLQGRFLVICLEYLRPYVGEFVAGDPQRRLDLPKPRLPNGETPRGFLGFAVNMINVDSKNLVGLTANGYGLRETLLFDLSSHLQVYTTRDDLFQALPSITAGALSLDGGMMRSNCEFCLGNRGNVDVIFSKSSGTLNLPNKYLKADNRMREMKLKEEMLVEDMKREEALLNDAKFNYETKKKEFIKFQAENGPNESQHQAERD